MLNMLWLIFLLALVANVNSVIIVEPPAQGSTVEVEKTQQATPENEANLLKAKTELVKVLSLIYNRYELGSPSGGQFFLASNNIGEDSWNIIKNKFGLKIVQKNSTFLMTFGGSSVTAGHDNRYNQSYPYIVRKRLGPVFQLLGIDLVVHNIAQGANNCSPFILCYESMGGVDPDFVGWEQSYNCGHDEGIFESAARVSANKGTIVYYSASGAWAPNDCPESKDVPPFCDEEWTPKAAGLAEWNATQMELELEKEALIRFNQDKASSARFSGSFVKEYKGTALHGFNVWEKNSHCTFTNPKNGKTESCNGIDAAGGCTGMRFMTHEAALYGSENQKGASWHPPRAFHMLRGEAIVWIYGLILLETINGIEEELRVKSREALAAEFKAYIDNLPGLPNPKKCGFYHCERHPVCFTDYKPHYSQNMTLSEIVLAQTNWTYDAEEYGEWSLKYGYLDAKPSFKGAGPEQGELHLKISIGDADFLWLCGAVKESLMHAVFYLDKDLDTAQFQSFGERRAGVGSVGSEYVPSATRQVWSEVKPIQNECRELYGLPKGNHILSIATDPAQPTHVSGLTHLIRWP